MPQITLSDPTQGSVFPISTISGSAASLNSEPSRGPFAKRGDGADGTQEESLLNVNQRLLPEHLGSIKKASTSSLGVIPPDYHEVNTALMCPYVIHKVILGVPCTL